MKCSKCRSNRSQSMFQYGDMFFCGNCHKEDMEVSTEEMVGIQDSFMQGYQAALNDLERIVKTMLPVEGMVPAKWLSDRIKGLKNGGRSDDDRK